MFITYRPRQDGIAGNEDHPQATQVVLPLHTFRVIDVDVTLAEQVCGGHILPEVSSSSSTSVLAGTGDGALNYRRELEDMYNTPASRAKRQRSISVGNAASLGFAFVAECK
jgi:hypothetical protein